MEKTSLKKVPNLKVLSTRKPKPRLEVIENERVILDLCHSPALTLARETRVGSLFVKDSKSKGVRAKSIACDKAKSLYRAL